MLRLSLHLGPVHLDLVIGDAGVDEEEPAPLPEFALPPDVLCAEGVEYVLGVVMEGDEEEE